MLKYINAVNGARQQEAIASDPDSVVAFIAKNGTCTSTVLCGIQVWDTLATHEELVPKFGTDGSSGTYAGLPIFVLAAINPEIFCVATFDGHSLQCAQKTVFK